MICSLPTSQNARVKPLHTQRASGFEGNKSLSLGQRSSSPLCDSSLRSQKHKVLCPEPAKTPPFSGYDPGCIDSRCSSTQKIVFCDPLSITGFNRNRKLRSCNVRRGFVSRAKSALSVDRGVGAVEGNREVGSEERGKYDAIVIGSGIGGLVAATQLAVKGAKVLVLEKYVIPGGSSGYYERDGYTFDVGSSVMFGFSDKVSLFLDVLTLFCYICYLFYG